jgi:NAD dependent epimerase/dehydratase family
LAQSTADADSEALPKWQNRRRVSNGPPIVQEKSTGDPSPRAEALNLLMGSQMKVVVVGGTGTIGAAVATALEANKHEVIRASRQIAPRIDISDPASIRRFFTEVKDLDAVVSCAGDARFAPLDKLEQTPIKLHHARK